MNAFEKQKKLSAEVKAILEESFWVNDLKSDTVYGRIHDDDDGNRIGSLVVNFDAYGDARLKVEGEEGQVLRFRTSGGGGRSLRVRNALMILAYAIQLDNDRDPEMAI